jgi:hypothetical protein
LISGASLAGTSIKKKGAGPRHSITSPVNEKSTREF